MSNCILFTSSKHAKKNSEQKPRRQIIFCEIIFWFEMEKDYKMIQIPIMNAPGEYIKFFPDELPADPYDVIDVLRSELAPLKVWRNCAVCISIFIVLLIF